MGEASLRAERPLAVVILAAGKGSRLGGGDALPPKPLLDCLGLPLLEHVRRALAPLAAEHTLVVTGHRAEDLEAWLGASWGGARAVRQVPQNGTGHAARLALEALPDFEGDVLVVYGDVPQLASTDLAELLAVHRAEDAQATVLTGVIAEPGMLGRVVRDEAGAFARIVEARDATPHELELREFNTGLYAFAAGALRTALGSLSTDNVQGEEYLTDAVGAVRESGGRVEAVVAPEGGALLGVNDWADLATAVATLRARICTEHMRRGVRITDPATTVIEADVAIEPGARILPVTHIGTGCRIGAGAKVGPFARLRGGTVLEAGAEIGNFVEVKGSTVGAGAKAKHLTYLGDAEVGPRANVGCGVVTANYDGQAKHRTHIGPDASIGSGTVLVAPTSVGAGGRTGANAVVLPDHAVPPGATAVGVPSRVLPSEADSGEDAAGHGSPEEQAGESTQS
ncbi:MAG: NTP transferase domain-containing protein [Planctomycetota bacterium]|nr:NTP transferase domain-containing protein [Planctomycetota bacterium]